MPFNKGDYLPGVFFRVVLENVVPALRKNRQFTLFQIPIKSHPLLNLEKVTPVRIHHQARAADRRDGRPQIENASTVATAVPAA